MASSKQRARKASNVPTSGNPKVDFIKARTAELREFCEQYKVVDPQLAGLAQAAYDEAEMWAVKAATAGK